jgi:hypothetical protein
MAQTPLYLEITEHPGTDSPSPGLTTPGSDSSLPGDYRTSRYRLSFTWTNNMARTPLYLEITEHPGTDSPSPGTTTWLRLLST